MSAAASRTGFPSFPPATPSPSEWLQGGGELGALIRSIDWSATPLGPRDRWPASLRALLNTVLGSRFPTALLWGRELLFLYNDAYRVIAADKHPDALGRSSRDVWPEVWHINGPIFAAVLDRGETVYLEDAPCRIDRGAGMEDASFTLCYSPARGEDGEVQGALVTLQETTRLRERKQAEAALRDLNQRLQQADRRKNEFLAVLSHELRNPLAPIRNSLFILDRVAPGGEQARRAQQVIARQVRYLHRLVDDLLETSRITQGKVRLQREVLDLNALVRRSVDDHRAVFEEARLTLDLVEEARVRVDGDATRLAQVVGNLLANARKFTSPGGGATVSVGAEGASAVIRVRDNGVGIDPSLLERMFEPFVQAERTLDRTRGGLGLGLAVLRGIVELHGGRVQAHSEGRGQGAEFTVTLPAVAVERERRSRQRLRAATVRPRRIVVIEDNLDAAETLKAVLELDGHRVVVAHDGREGIEVIRDTRPDLVLCDIGLPGVSGLEVARAVRSDPELAHTQLVAVSGYALPDDLEKARQAGFDRHLAKPVDPASLAAL